MAVSVCEYGTATLPGVSVELVDNVRAAGLTVIERFFVIGDEPLSATCAVKLKVPAAIGVPDSNPLPLRVSPPGNDPEARLNTNGPVPPEAASVCEYAVPTVAPGNVEAVEIPSDEVIVMDRALLAVWDWLSVT